MTLRDGDFLRAIGIEPYDLDEGMVSLWKVEPKPDFIPPTYLQEYLACYPTGIWDAVGEVAGGWSLSCRAVVSTPWRRTSKRCFWIFLQTTLRTWLRFTNFTGHCGPESAGISTIT